MTLNPNEWTHGFVDEVGECPEFGPQAEWWATDNHLDNTPGDKTWYIIRIVDADTPYTIYKSDYKPGLSRDWLLRGYTPVASFPTLETAAAAYRMMVSTL
jgi:hypothetical protein